MDEIKKCDYCGRPAIHQFKTGKRSWCCSKNIAQCPAIRSCNSEKAKKRPPRKHSEETKEKIRQSNLGLKRSEETKEKLRKPKSEEHKKKMSIIAQNRSQEHKDKISATLKKKYASGEIKVWCDGTKGVVKPWNKGKKHSQETRDKISKTRTQRIASGEIKPISGEDHYLWVGDAAARKYCGAWLDKEYKKDIKERDNNECQNPSCRHTADHVHLHIHHIDYDKKNCRPDNLITVCMSCNIRANTNQDYWTKHYQDILSKKYGYEY